MGLPLDGWTKQFAKTCAVTVTSVPGEPSRMGVLPTLAMLVDVAGSAAQPVSAHFSTIVKEGRDADAPRAAPYVAPAKVSPERARPLANVNPSAMTSIGFVRLRPAVLAGSQSEPAVPSCDAASCQLDASTVVSVAGRAFG